VCVGFASSSKNHKDVIGSWSGVDDRLESAIGFDADGVATAGTTRFVMAAVLDSS